MDPKRSLATRPDREQSSQERRPIFGLRISSCGPGRGDAGPLLLGDQEARRPEARRAAGSATAAIDLGADALWRLDSGLPVEVLRGERDVETTRARPGREQAETVDFQGNGRHRRQTVPSQALPESSLGQEPRSSRSTSAGDGRYRRRRWPVGGDAHRWGGRQAPGGR